MSADATREIISIARLLEHAQRSGVPVDYVSVAPLFAHLDLDDCYRVQSELIRRKTGESRPVGWKVGLTNAGAQRRYLAREPCYGRLLASSEIHTGGAAPSHEFFQPMVELELGLVLGCDVGEIRDRSVAADAIDRWFAAIEIVDSRFTSWQVPVGALIADNSAFAGFVRGRSVADAGSSIQSLVIRHAHLEISGQRHRADDPSVLVEQALDSLIWLSAIGSRHGRGLRQGDVVLSGTMVTPVAVGVGDLVTGFIDGVGEVSLRT